MHFFFIAFERQGWVKNKSFSLAVFCTWLLSLWIILTLHQSWCTRPHTDFFMPNSAHSVHLSMFKARHSERFCWNHCPYRAMSITSEEEMKKNNVSCNWTGLEDLLLLTALRGKHSQPCLQFISWSVTSGASAAHCTPAPSDNSEKCSGHAGHQILEPAAGLRDKERHTLEQPLAQVMLQLLSKGWAASREPPSLTSLPWPRRSLLGAHITRGTGPAGSRLSALLPRHGPAATPSPRPYRRPKIKSCAS